MVLVSLALAAALAAPPPAKPAAPAAKKSAPAKKESADRQDVMAQAMAELDAGRTREAIAQLKDILEQNPDNYGVWFNLGVAYGVARDDEHAIEAFRKVLALEPNLYEAQLNLGTLLMQHKSSAEAITVLTAASTQKPDETRPHELLGRLLMIDNKPADAVPHLRAVLKAQPKNEEALLLLARALTTLEQTEEAAATWKAYLELKPDNASAKLALGQLLERAKRTGEAAKLYADTGANPDALAHAATLEMAAGDVKNAITHLEQAVKLAPTAALRLSLATAYLKGNETDKAQAVAQELLQQSPGYLEARMFYGRLLRDQKKHEQAAAQFLAATKLKPDSLEAWNELTGALILAQNYPLALQTIEKVRALGGETAAYFWFRAIMQDALKMHKEALESYSRFLSLSNGKSPDEEFKARQRVRILKKVINK